MKRLAAPGRMPPLGPLGRRRAGAALVGLGTLVAGLEWRRVFDEATVVPLVVAAAALPTVLAVLLAGGRPRSWAARSGTTGANRPGSSRDDRPAPARHSARSAAPGAPAPGAESSAPRSLTVTGLASVALLVTFTFAAVLRAPDVAALLDGLLHGWSRILTTTLPAPTQAELLVLPTVATWVAALAGAELALRARYPTLSLLAPVAAYGLAILFGVGGPGPRLAPAAAALVVELAAGAVLAGAGSEPTPAGGPSGPRVVRTRAGRRSVLSRRAVSAAALVVACTAGGVALGPRLPLATAREPYDPREAQQPPADQLEAIDPLSLLAGWNRDPESVLFTVTAPQAERWRLAVLDIYDPDRGWSGQTELRPSGRILPEGDATPTPSEEVEQEVTVGELGGVWLPAADRPTAVTGVEPLVDPDTGVLVHRRELEEGLRYRVTSTVPAEEPDCTRATAAPLGPADTASALPPDLVDLTQGLTRDATSPCARAQRIQEYLTSDAFEFNAQAPSGTTLGRLRDLLEPGEGPGVGTSEQFASAFVLMARAAGLPARVAVGFHGGERVDGTYRVHAADAFAWGEVHFDELGWVAFDPTPVPGDQPPPPETAEKEVEQDPSGGATAPTTTVPVVEGQDTVGPPAGDGGGTGDRLVLVAVGVGIGLVVVVVALVVAVALARRLRRRRRSSSPDPSERALGAWRQCVEELRSAGVRPERSDTAADYVGRSRIMVGDDAAQTVVPVARLANGLLFGGPPASEADAAAAWRAVHELTELTGAGRTPGDKIRRALDVRSLVGA